MKKHDKDFRSCRQVRSWGKAAKWSFLFALLFSGMTEVAAVGNEKSNALGNVSGKESLEAELQNDGRKTITGIVTDENGDPMVGVVVLIKGKDVRANFGAETDKDGHYSITIPDGTESLSFNFVGMENQVVQVKNKTRINVVMKNKNTELDEVVVTGYQRVDKRRSTSAISTVKADDILVPGMTSIDQALEGRIPELLLTTNSGEVGATPRIRVRGTTTIMGNREPLWVLDGFIMTDPVDISPDDLNDPDYINLVGNAIAGINPQDIERIDVLKDASATALYGTQAANGVIVVTTKKGSVGKPRFTYNHSSKFSSRPRYSDRAINLMNSVERVQFGKELTDLHYQFPAKMPLVGYEGAYYKYYTGQTTWDEFQAEVAMYESSNTDWFKILTQDAYSHDHTFKLSGGTEDVRYYISLGADFEEGVSRTTNTRRYTAMTNLDISFTDKFRASFSLNGNVQNRNNLRDGVNSMNYAYNTSRTIPAYNADGTYYYYGAYGPQSNNVFNYNIMNEIDNSSNQQRGSTIGANLTLRYDVIEGLELSLAGNYNHSATMQEQWWGEKSFHVADLRNAEYGAVPPTGDNGLSRLPYGGILNTNNYEQDSYTFRFQVDYRKLFGYDMQHLITAMGGYEMNGNTSHSIADEERGYLRDRGMQFITNVDLERYPHYQAWLRSHQPSIGHSINHSLSGYLTLSYSLKNYFTLNANGRFDASNKFGSESNRKFRPIWSVSGMWNLKETFIRRETALSDLRLRGSYGTQGTQPSGAGAIPSLVLQQNTLNTMYNEFTSTVAGYPNPNLKWEVTHQYNVSMDLYLFNSRLGLSGDFYYKKTYDCIVPIEVSSVNGVATTLINNGNLENKGYSVSLTATPVQTRDWRWNIFTYFSGNLNRVQTNTADIYQIGDYLNGTAIVNGEAISTFYSYKFLGLNPNNGAPVFNDYSDHKHLLEGKSLEDIVLMTMTNSGQRDPIFSGSFSTTVSWKRLSLSMNFSYNLGSKVRLFALYTPIINGISAESNVRKEFLDRWMAPGDELNTNIPAIMSPADPDYNSYFQHFSTMTGLTDDTKSIPQFASSTWDMYDKSDLRVISGSYFKCTSVSIRYSLEPKWLKKTPFSNIQVSLSGMNLFTVSAKELKGQDPSQAGFAMPSLSSRPSYTMQVSLSF